MNKQALIQYLSNCQQVINNELTLLQNWNNDPGISPGRAAQCQAATLYIQSGLTAPASLVQNILNQASALADAIVLKDPTPQHLLLLKHCQDSISTRLQLNNPGALSPSVFENAIGMAQDNSHQVADCASSIYQDSTG